MGKTPAGGMDPEYDFQGGVRGKYAKAYRRGHTVRVPKSDGAAGTQPVDDPIEDILLEAGEILAERFRSEVDTSEKERFDLVTCTDAEVESLIIERLKEAFPDDGFLGEESGEHLGQSGNRWLIDPLDGTTDFVMGKPYFAVSLARECNGRVAEGYVYNPISGELYSAGEDDGAYLNGSPISVSPTAGIREALVVFGFSARMESIQRYYHDWAAVFEGCLKGVGWTSPALTLCNVARGRIDAFIDFGASSVGQAAGAFILKHAGGVLLNYDLSNYDHTVTGLIGTTPTLFAELLEMRRQGDGTCT